MSKKKIAILGSTGSIGTQTLEVIEEHPDLFEAYALTANHNADFFPLSSSLPQATKPVAIKHAHISANKLFNKSFFIKR